jgi:predicted house-cleaning noncanonical NTP pyrophosphatase (MazG superfamily)
VKNIKNFKDYSVNEQLTIKLIEELDNYLIEDINESIKDWFNKITQFFNKVNDSVRNIMLTILEKGYKSFDLLKNFFGVIMKKIKSLKDKHPVLYRTVITTIILLIILFVLCSAAASSSKHPSEKVINGAIGMLQSIQEVGSNSYDESTLTKAQAYLFDLKNNGKVTDPIFGENVKQLAKTAMNAVESNIKAVRKSSGEDGSEELNNLLKDFFERGTKMIGYEIVKYQNELTGENAEKVIIHTKK